MSQPLAELAVLTMSWIVYFAVHSFLAGITAKRWAARRRPQWMPVYRLSYNAIAVVLLVVPVALIYLINGEYLWRWTGAESWVANGTALLALLALLWSLRYYDGAMFSGWRQLRQGLPRAENPGPLRLSPLHRVVRHPWYFLGLVIL